MKNIALIVLCLFCLCGCDKVVKVIKPGGVVKQVVKTAGKSAAVNAGRKLTAAELGPALAKAISVLSKESQEYLLKLLADKPELLAFFKENPKFVSTWEHLRKYLPEMSADPEFLRMFLRVNDYASYAGNRLENFMFKQLPDGSIQVLSKDGEHLLATIKPGRIIEVVGQDVNNWFLQLKPIPNAKYVINGTEYFTDDAGRIIGTKAKLPLKNPAGFRESNVQKQMGRLKGSQEGDHAGHLIGDQFGGSSNMVNLVPMKGGLNTGAYKQMENEWRRAIKAGKEVNIEIKMKYPTQPPGSERPDWIEVVYEIDGQKVTKLFKNV